MLSAEDFGAGGQAAAHGLKKIGQGMGKLTAMAVETAQEDDAMDLMRADLAKRSAILEAERAFDTDTNYDTYGPRFESAAQGIDSSAAGMIRNPKAREKWLMKEQMDNMGRKDRLLGQALNRKRDAKVAEIRTVLDGHKVNYLKPGITDDDRARIESDMDAAVGVAEKSAMITPNQALELRRGYIGGAVADAYEDRILNDPEGVMRELDALPADPLPDYRSQSGPASIRYNNPGAMWPGPSSQKFGAVETVNLKDGQGNKIAVFPDAVSGAAAQFDLLATKYAGKTLSSAISTWSGGNSVKTYLDVIERETGVKPGTRLTPDLLSDPRIAIPIAKAMAVQEAGKPYPLSDDQWQTAFNRATGREEPQKVAENKAGVTATDLPPVNSGRAHLLTSDQRRSLADKARGVLKANLNDAISRDIERIKAGLDPVAGPDGLTAIDRAERALPGKAEKWRIKWDQAQAERAAIAPLETMSEEQANEHIAALRETPGLQKRASDAWKKQLKLRDEDPVTAISRDPELVQATAIAQKRNASLGIEIDGNGDAFIAETPEGATVEDRHRAMKSIFEARLEAQERRGIDEYQRRVITAREAKNLLQIPSATGLDDRKYRAALEEAADRARDWYGPENAKRVMEEAIGFQRGTRTNDKKRFEDRLLAALATGEDIAPGDMKRYNELSQATERMSREFALPDPTAGDDSRPYIGQPNKNAPTDGHVSWLKENISDPSAIAIFDGKFGEGAAARALYAGQEARTTRDLGFDKQKPAPQSGGLFRSLFGN